MSSKNDYTPAEWELLQRSILEAGAAMVALQTGGFVRESLAVFKTLEEARERYPEGSLIAQLADEDTEPYAAAGIPAVPDQASYPENVKAMLSMLRQAVSVLEQKGTAEELEHYRTLVVHVVEQVARASRTGSFLGIGGKPINEEEAALIAEIRTYLQPTG